MKKILLILTTILVFSSPAEAVETKKVCHDTVVKGNKVQQCKMVKVHKKFEGTKIPPKK
jgi:hypothetical protein